MAHAVGGFLLTVARQWMTNIIIARGVEFLLNWRQQFGAKIQLGTAHIIHKLLSLGVHSAA